MAGWGEAARAAQAVREVAALAKGFRDRPAAERISALGDLAQRRPLLVKPISDLLLKELRLSIYHRVQAATVLAGLGEAYQDQAATDLARLLAHRDEDVAPDQKLYNGDPDGRTQQLLTAQAIAALGPRYREQAAEALRGVMNAYAHGVRIDAAAALGRLGEPWRTDEAAPVLRQFWQRPEKGWHGGNDLALRAARELGAWGGTYRQEMIDAFRALAADPTFHLLRMTAIRELVDVDPGSRAEAVGYALDSVAARGLFEAQAVRSAVQTAVSLYPECAEQAATLLRASMAAPDPAHSLRPHIAAAFVDLGPEYHDEAVAALLGVIEDPGYRRLDLTDTTDVLAKISPEHADVGYNLLLGILLDPGENDDWVVAHVCEELAVRDFGERAAAAVQTVADDLGDGLDEGLDDDPARADLHERLTEALWYLGRR